MNSLKYVAMPVQRIFAVLAIFALILTPMSQLFAAPAPKPDSCGEEFTYTFSAQKHSPYGDDSSKPANVDYKETFALGTPDTITVTADTGFVITKVELSIDDDHKPGFVTVASGPVTDLNPSGTSINVAKITVKKVCPDLCPNITGDQYTIPDGMVVNGAGSCVTPVVDLCPNIEGDQETLGDYVLNEGSCYIIGCMNPAATNYDSQATMGDNSCTFPAVPGCMDETASNYNPQATEDNDSCQYEC